MNAVKAFDAAARRKGFTAAAQELTVSPGAISRHVANLEQYLGCNLFERHHNEIDLTPAGQEYFSRIRSALDVIEDASERLVERSNPRLVNVTALPTFAMRWLIPRLPKFTAMFPDVGIQLSSHTGNIEENSLEIDSVDIAVHFSFADISSENCDLLFEAELQAVCSPGLSASSGPIKADSVLQHTLLYTVTGLTQWREWFVAAGLDPSLANRGIKFSNSALALQAAVEGVGIALGETACIQQDIAAGRLVSVEQHRVFTGYKYFMSINPSRADVPWVDAFRNWLLSEIRNPETV